MNEPLVDILLRLSALTPLLLPGLLLWPLVTRSYRRLRQPISGGERAARWGVVGLAGLLILPGTVGLAAGGMKVLLGARAKAGAAQCLSNVRKLGSALTMYVQDWDGNYPPAALWGDGAARYILPEDPTVVFRCPSGPTPFGYAYNPALAEVLLNRIEIPADTIALLEFDASDRNAAADRGPASVARRHMGGATYGFADGHAKWMDPHVAPKLRWEVGEAR
jgi:prepilin-type processing-associated H-X9-DG protein